MNSTEVSIGLEDILYKLDLVLGADIVFFGFDLEELMEKWE